jgi:hypothetical protein
MRTSDPISDLHVISKPTHSPNPICDSNLDRYLMPIRNSKIAPYFSGEPSYLLRFFEDIEDHADRAKLSDVNQMRWCTHYANPIDAETWELLPSYALGDYQIWKRDILSMYPSCDPDRRYVISDLLQLVATNSRKSISTKDTLGAYHRDFMRISLFLMARDRLSKCERNQLYLQSFSMEFRSRICFRLAIVHPDIHPDDTYDISDVYKAAIFTLEATSHAPIIYPFHSTISDQLRFSDPLRFSDHMTSECDPVSRHFTNQQYPTTALSRPYVTSPSRSTRPSDLLRFSVPQLRFSDHMTSDRDPSTRTHSQFAHPIPANTYNLRKSGQRPTSQSCLFCGASKIDHVLRTCPISNRYQHEGRCSKASDGRIMLPDGSPIPPQIRGRFLCERIDNYHELLDTWTLSQATDTLPIASSDPDTTSDRSADRGANFATTCNVDKTQQTLRLFDLGIPARYTSTSSHLHPDTSPTTPKRPEATFDRNHDATVTPVIAREIKDLQLQLQRFTETYASMNIPPSPDTLPTTPKRLEATSDRDRDPAATSAIVQDINDNQHLQRFMSPEIHVLPEVRPTPDLLSDRISVPIAPDRILAAAHSHSDFDALVNQSDDIDCEVGEVQELSKSQPQSEAIASPTILESPTAAIPTHSVAALALHPYFPAEHSPVSANKILLAASHVAALRFLCDLGCDALYFLCSLCYLLGSICDRFLSTFITPLSDFVMFMIFASLIHAMSNPITSSTFPNEPDPPTLCAERLLATYCDSDPNPNLRPNKQTPTMQMTEDSHHLTLGGEPAATTCSDLVITGSNSLRFSLSDPDLHLDLTTAKLLSRLLLLRLQITSHPQHIDLSASAPSTIRMTEDSHDLNLTGDVPLATSPGAESALRSHFSATSHLGLGLLLPQYTCTIFPISHIARSQSQSQS